MESSRMIVKFRNDEFELSGLDSFMVVTDNEEPEEMDLNGFNFSNLLNCF